jgi:hypothetical protein
LVQFSLSVGTTHAAKLWLVEHAPKLNNAERIEADGHVVDALAAHYKVEATASTRPVLSGWTFSPKGGDAGYKVACNCANVALSRTRAIILGKQKAAPDAMTAFDKAVALIAKKIGEGDKEAVRAAKRLILLVNAAG